MKTLTSKKVLKIPPIAIISAMNFSKAIAIIINNMLQKNAHSWCWCQNSHILSHVDEHFILSGIIPFQCLDMDMRYTETLNLRVLD